MIVRGCVSRFVSACGCLGVGLGVCGCVRGKRERGTTDFQDATQTTLQINISSLASKRFNAKRCSV